jgi:dCMP deaminase
VILAIEIFYMSRPDLDTWALQMADLIATRSKDPSKKVGALILRADGSAASMGFNGFPRGTDDSPELYADKTVKLARIVHAEINAIIAARQPLEGCTIYVSPLMPCSQCAAAIIQSGIKKVVAKTTDGGERWKASFDETRRLFSESGVQLVIVD